MAVYSPSIVADLIPANSKVLEVLKTTVNDVTSVSIDYSIENSRYLVTYFSDGKVRKSVLDKQNGDILINENDEVTKTYNKNDVKKFERSQEQIDKINQLVEERKFDEIEQLENTTVKVIDGKTYILMENRGASKICFFGGGSATDVPPSPDNPDWKKYKAKFKLNRYTYSQALDDAGYSNVYLDIYVYETMDYFSEVSTTVKFFDAGTAVDAISLFWDVAKSSSVSWLTAAVDLCQ